MTKSAIFDIDGVLADASRRVDTFIRPQRAAGKPIDWPAFFKGMDNDPPIASGVNLCRALHDSGYNIIISTGRPDTYCETTTLWLEDTLSFLDYMPDLYMREAIDRRDDTITKMEVLRTIRSQGYFVEFAVDDRARITKAYQKADVPGVIAFNHGDF